MKKALILMTLLINSMFLTAYAGDFSYLQNIERIGPYRVLYFGSRIDSIGGLDVTYYYGERIHKIGDYEVTYFGDKIYRVADMYVTYDGDKLERIGMYEVVYDGDEFYPDKNNKPSQPASQNSSYPHNTNWPDLFMLLFNL